MRKKFKGPAALALDTWYSTGSVEDNLRQARELLRSPQDFSSIVRDLKDRGHGKPEFDGYPENNSVLRGPEFERVASDRYLSAIGVALGHNPPVPIRTTWETGAGNTGLEIEITNGVDHVEVTVRLPGVEIDDADVQRHRLTDVRTED
jgi:hypothetical protein